MFSSGKYDHAADCFQLVATHTRPQESTFSDARSQLAWSRLGAAYTNADQHEQAMLAYQGLPDMSLRTAFNMAILHVRADRYDQAIKLLLDSLVASRREMDRLGLNNNNTNNPQLVRGEDDVWGLISSISNVYCKFSHAKSFLDGSD
jgi:hypothetical protein